MGLITREALTDALFELSVNDLVAIQYEMNKGKMVEEIMEHDLDDITQALDNCGLHRNVLTRITLNMNGDETDGPD